MASTKIDPKSLHKFLASSGYAINTSPGDGHCLLHSFITSAETQLNKLYTLDDLKCRIYTESINNIAHYLQFITNNSRSLFTTYLRQYILYKQFNNQFGDIAPLILSNATGTTINIINELQHHSIEEIDIKPRVPTDRTISIHRKGDHFNGLNFTPKSPTIQSTTSKVIKYSSDQLRQLSSKCSHIERKTRKRLFQLHLWQPKTSRRPFDTNHGSHPSLLRSLPKSTILYHNNTDLHLAFVNTCSIRNKTNDFIKHNIDSDYDACFVTETWLQDNNPSDNATIAALNTDSHTFISCPRTNSNRGGGIGIFHKKSLKVHVISHQILSTFEMCTAKIQSNSNSIIAVCIYRPPYSTKNRKTVPMFNDEFADVCSSLLADYSDKKLVVMGDFNIHMDDMHSADTKSFNDILDTFGWHQHVEDPTHTSGHTIDLCITASSSDLHVSKPTIGYLISDHAFISFHAKVPRPPTYRQHITSRATSRINNSALRQDLINLTEDLLAKESTMDLADLAIQYDIQLKKLLDKHAPLKSRWITPRACVAWFDLQAKQLKSNLRKLEKIWRKSGDPTDLAKVKETRKSYMDHLRKSKTTHFHDSIKEAGSNGQN